MEQAQKLVDGSKPAPPRCGLFTKLDIDGQPSHKAKQRGLGHKPQKKVPQRRLRVVVFFKRTSGATFCEIRGVEAGKTDKMNKKTKLFPSQTHSKQRNEGRGARPRSRTKKQGASPRHCFLYDRARQRPPLLPCVFDAWQCPRASHLTIAFHKGMF
jgi:hypothetical protein